LSELVRPLPKLGAYALTALLLAAYALVLWWALHPTVPDNYRSYYIDQTTTCMDQPVAGTYTLGTVVSFLPDGAAAARPIKPCGWEGPAGDGTHAVGTSSRLRFAYAEPAPGALTLSLEMIAIRKQGEPMPQTVDVIVNDQPVGTLHVTADAAHRFAVQLPATLVQAAAGRIDLLLEFPTAVRMGPTDPPTRWRSIKLLAAGLLPA
jgi:hypothetical protein